MELLVSCFWRGPLSQSSAKAYPWILGSHLEGNIQVDNLDFDWIDLTTTGLATIVIGSWDRLLMGTDHDVVGLQVTMTNVVSVHVFGGLEKLAHNWTYQILAEQRLLGLVNSRRKIDLKGGVVKFLLLFVRNKLRQTVVAGKLEN